MVLMWNQFWRRLRPYPDESLPGVRTTNWSVETNSPTSYLSQASIPYFSGTALTFDTPVDQFLDLTNNQDSQTGTAHFSAVASLVTIIGAMTFLVLSGYSTCWGFIISWIRCMLIPHLLYHRKSLSGHYTGFGFHLNQHTDHRTECNVHTHSW